MAKRQAVLLSCAFHRACRVFRGFGCIACTRLLAHLSRRRYQCQAIHRLRKQNYPNLEIDNKSPPRRLFRALIGWRSPQKHRPQLVPVPRLAPVPLRLTSCEAVGVAQILGWEERL